jgi:SAM-dependent methyltransferase
VAYALRAGPCPACGGTALDRIGYAPVQGRFTVARCSGCGLGITMPPPSDSEIQALYPPEHYGSGGPRYRPVVERVAAWFRRRRASWITRLRPPGAVLEVGCGHGYMLAALRERRWTVQGVELHDDAAAYGRQVLNLPIAVGGLAALRFPAASFDVIVFWHSFEHLPQPRAILQETARLLRPGGLVIVAVPNISSWQARWAGSSWFHWEIPRHLYHFDAQSLTGLFRRADLEVTHVSHANWEQNPFGWMQSVLNRLGFARNQFFAGLWSVPTDDRSDGRFRLAVERLLVAPVLLGGLALAAVETAFRKGGTMTVVGRRPAEDR